uniref:Uncharacterized protein n=1 Tax=Ixodes ricinus TaxID=34613 RepID=A0A147BFK8_IXORI
MLLMLMRLVRLARPLSARNFLPLSWSCKDPLSTVLYLCFCGFAFDVFSPLLKVSTQFFLCVLRTLSVLSPTVRNKAGKCLANQAFLLNIHRKRRRERTSNGPRRDFAYSDNCSPRVNPHRILSHLQK